MIKVLYKNNQSQQGIIERSQAIKPPESNDFCSGIINSNLGQNQFMYAER